MERTITIRGPIESITQAEQKISMKLRQCWESDMSNAVGSAFTVCERDFIDKVAGESFALAILREFS